MLREPDRVSNARQYINTIQPRQSLGNAFQD
jgi:hypothetical protein